MSDEQCHLGISVLTVMPPAFKALQFWGRTHEQGPGKLAPAEMGRHAGRKSTAAGVMGIVDAQATWQSRCRRGTCGWSSAGLPGSQWVPTWAWCPELRSLSPWKLTPSFWLQAIASPFFLYSWTMCWGAARASCSQRADGTGTEVTDTCDTGPSGEVLGLSSHDEESSPCQHSPRGTVCTSPGWELTVHSGGDRDRASAPVKLLVICHAPASHWWNAQCVRGLELHLP